MNMIRTVFYSAAALTGFVLVSSSTLHADSLAPAQVKKSASSGPTVTTYTTGLTNPRGLTFGPDGHLYVAEAGVGGGQTAADIDPRLCLRRWRKIRTHHGEHREHGEKQLCLSTP